MRAPLVKFPNPIHFDKLTKVMEIRGVDTYVHWSVLAVSAFILANGVSHPGLSILGLGCLLQRPAHPRSRPSLCSAAEGLRVLSIRLYPVFGVTDL